MITTTKLQAQCKLDVPLFGSRTESRSIEPRVVAARWTVNSHLEADELTLTLDVRDAGIDVRTIKNARVVFWLWDANQEDFDSEKHLQFVGIVTDAEREIEEEASHVRLTAKDYTILFLEQKGVSVAAQPEWSDTLPIVWEKLCENTGYLDRSTGKIVSSVDALRDRVVFANEADAVRTIGEIVPKRMQAVSKAFPNAKNPWALWTGVTGAMGLHTFIDRDRVVVVRASDFYDDSKAAMFLYGANIKSISERVETSKHAKGVCLQSFDPMNGRVLEAFYPPPGTETIRTARPGAQKRTVAEDYDVFSYPAVQDQTTLEARAREAYEERSRQELQGKVTTAETRVWHADDAVRSDGSSDAPSRSIFDLAPGQGVRVEWDLAGEDVVRGLDPRARYLHYIERGYSEDTAVFLAEDAERASRLANHVHHIRSMTVSVDWHTARYDVEIDYHNRIDLG